MQIFDQQSDAGAGSAGGGTAGGGSAGGGSAGGGSAAAGVGGDQRAVQRPAISRGGAILQSIKLTGASLVNPVQGPAYFVPADAVVEVMPLSGNTATVQYSVGLGPQAAVTGPFEFVTNNANPREIAIRSLHDLWVLPKVANEGIQVTIRRAK